MAPDDDNPSDDNPNAANDPNDDDTVSNQYLPERFGRYVVRERIGLGGFATVYSAHDPELNSTVAVKVLADNHSADGEIRRRFIEEARVAREIASDRLVNVYDVGQTEDKRPYVVMQFADRGTLGDRLAEVLEPTSDDLRQLITEMATCLTAIHDRNVVHRDIKPSNLLLHSIKGRDVEDPAALIRSDERIVLADFGLARDISGGVSGMTIAGGTAGYMAPEQLRPDGQPDHRADLYAASSIIAAISCGVHPERLNLPECDLPEGLRKLLIEHLSQNPEERPASAAQWRNQLLAVLSLSDATEADVNDRPSSLHETQRWQPPPQPEIPPTPSPSPPPSPSASSPPQPPASSWRAPPLPHVAASHQFATDRSHTPVASVPPNQGFAQPHRQTPNFALQSNTPIPQISPMPSLAYAFARGAIALITSFIVLYVLAWIVLQIEGELGMAARLAVALAVFGPMVTCLVGIKYLPWPRPRA